MSEHFLEKYLRQGEPSELREDIATLLDALKYLRAVMGHYQETPEEILVIEYADKAIAKVERILP